MMRGPDQADDGLAVDDRPPEVEGGHIPNEDQELLDIAAIGADALARHADLFGRRIGRKDQQSGVACRARRNEQDDHEEDQGDERLQHAIGDVFDGNLPWPGVTFGKRIRPQNLVNETSLSRRRIDAAAWMI